jgi:hypothetical protein
MAKIDVQALVLPCYAHGRSESAPLQERTLTVMGHRALDSRGPAFGFEVVDPKARIWTEHFYLTNDQAKCLAREILATDLGNES